MADSCKARLPGPFLWAAGSPGQKGAEADPQATASL